MIKQQPQTKSLKRQLSEKTPIKDSSSFSLWGKKRARPSSTGGTSKYRGVSWFKANKVWKAQITIHGKYKYLGYFDREEEAAIAYDLKALETHGAKSAKLNFPERLESLQRILATNRKLVAARYANTHNNTQATPFGDSALVVPQPGMEALRQQAFNLADVLSMIISCLGLTTSEICANTCVSPSDLNLLLTVNTNVLVCFEDQMSSCKSVLIFLILKLHQRGLGNLIPLVKSVAASAGIQIAL
mmetsp:Transcript_14980/g.26226  ORF Transcript_14980/g.26226 Transcript_14980/m.26226 type:complete len:244 (-) Transcript_14980:5795-6526(-)